MATPEVPLITLIPHEEKGGYIAVSPILRELVTEGDTLKETVEAVQDAITMLLEYYKKQPVLSIPTELPHVTQAEEKEISLVMLKQKPGGGFLATSPWFHELVVEGSTLEATIESARDALASLDLDQYTNFDALFSKPQGDPGAT